MCACLNIKASKYRGGEEEKEEEMIYKHFCCCCFNINKQMYVCIYV